MWSGPLSAAQRLNVGLHRVVLALICLVAILNAFRPMLDQVDLGWHVAQGRWMVHHLGFYRADVLNYPTHGQAVVDEYPLFQLALYLSTLGGWWGPCVLCALGYLLLLVILVLTGWAVDLGASSVFVLMLGAMLVDFSVAFPLRPHLVTFLGIAAFGSFLLRHREAGSWARFWPLALVQVIWTNSHSGFVLGPVMIALFGAEMVARRWLRSRIVPWTGVRTWTAATALVFLGCFVNPYGVLRFGAPFYQEHLQAIRAYVGEMQPLNPGAAAGFEHLTFYAALLVGLTIYLRRGAISWSFLLLAVCFYFEALDVKKAWPVFGVFLPLLVLSSGAFARTTITRRRGFAPFSVAGHIVVLVPLVAVLCSRLGGTDDQSLAVQWHEWEAGRTELPVAAAAWMREHHLTGRLLHRCEDGGWLQQEKLLPTFADTGFGKYDEGFIRQTGLLGLNPAMLGNFINTYAPDTVVCDGFAFEWPAYLQTWRLVFYSPNSSVYVRPATRPDLPAVTLPQVEAIFTDDIRRHGRPRNLLLYGRSLLALKSMGDPSFAVAQLTSLPPEMHRAGWYWEAARLMCFRYPPVPPDVQARLRAEAGQIGGPAFDFIVYDDESRGDLDGARELLVQHGALSDVEATLLLRIDARQNRPEALALARHEKLFDLSNGEHWQLLAELEEKAGEIHRAARAWGRQGYYAPERAFWERASFFDRFPDEAQIIPAGPVTLNVPPSTAR